MTLIAEKAASSSDVSTLVFSSFQASASTELGLGLGYVCGSVVECLSRKHISEAQFLTPQESWQVVGPHSTDAVSKPCCKAYRERRKQWELAPKKSAAMGRTFIHPSKGDTHLSPPRCAPVCVQDSGLNSASSGTEGSFLLVHVRSVSVNVAASSS